MPGRVCGHRRPAYTPPDSSFPVTVERLDRTLQRLRTRLSEAPKDIGTVLEAIRQGFRSTRSADIPWITVSLGNSIKLADSSQRHRACERNPHLAAKRVRQTGSCTARFGGNFTSESSFSVTVSRDVARRSFSTFSNVRSIEFK